MASERAILVCFSKSDCMHCERAKAILQRYPDVDVKYVNVAANAAAREWLLAQGLRTVPQLFAGDELLPGGADGLAKLDAGGLLRKKLGKPPSGAIATFL